MNKPPSKISGETFKKMLSPRGYLPRETKQALARVGKTSLIHRGEIRGVTKKEALKTMEMLKKEGVKISKNRYDRPLKVYNRVAKTTDRPQASLTKEKKTAKLIERQKAEAKERRLMEQKALADEQKKQAAEEAKQKRLRAYRSLEGTEEQIEEEEGKGTIEYDPRSVLGQRVVDEIEAEKSNRDKKAASEKEKREKLSKSHNVRREKPNLVDIDKLPDMDIG